MSKKVLTEEDIKRLPVGSPCYVEAGTILTLLARELASERHNSIVECTSPEELVNLKAHDRRISLGADHNGWLLKEQLRIFLQHNGYVVLNCGTGNQDAADYPDLVLEVANLVKEGRACRGVMIDESGTGCCIVANKIPGIRAAHCYDRFTARNSREHLDANFLTLSGIISFDLATTIVTTWLSTSFAGGSHEGTISKIEGIEKRFSQCTIVAVPGDPCSAL